MNTFAAVILYALAASVLMAVIYAARSVRLQNRFLRLGGLKGRHLEEILRVAGKPSHRVRMARNRELLEWRRVGFHIALMFTDGMCEGMEYVK